MANPTHLRKVRDGRWLWPWLLCGLLLPCYGRAALAQTPAAQGQPGQGQPTQGAPAQPAAGAATGSEAVAAGPHPEHEAPSKRHLRQAEDAYLAGAKKLERNDLAGAEREFAHALKLDPDNRKYSLAIEVARQNEVTELTRQAVKARLAGEQAKADALLAQARAIDPQNPLVVEHSGPGLGMGTGPAVTPGQAPGQLEKQPATGTGGSATSQPAVGGQMRADNDGSGPWMIQAPALEGPLRLVPNDALKSFHLRGVSADVIRDVASIYGIRAVIDNSVPRKDLAFDVDNVGYKQAMKALMDVANTFAVPIDESTVMVARDTPENRMTMEHQLQETIRMPGATAQQINELVNVARSVFGIKQVSAQSGTGNIVVNAPEDVLEPLNRTFEDIINSSGEVMIDVKLYEVDTTRTTNAGANIPSQLGIYNVNQQAESLVNANEGLVQQAVAQGLISATASNLTIAGELIASGLVQSTLLASTVGVIGGGSTLTGITETGSIGFNLGLNTTDARTLDDVQLRVGDRQSATFREGTKYPIVTSTYSTGLSTPPAALSNASVNGVSVASLLAQYSGGSSQTIPQVTYQDLGLTLDALPSIQKSGSINLKLDLKIQTLSGNTSDGNPILDNREFASDITVREGESVLMVGNASQTETAALTGIPGLSELPGFQMPLVANIEKDTDQLVMVITPHVVRRRADLVAGPRIAVPPQAHN